MIAHFAPDKLGSLYIQLWSYQYPPEPSGIGPLSGVTARALADRGHEVEVVSAHPHYPEPRWGRRLRPYRERRDGVHVLRLPISLGRASVGERIRRESSFTLAMAMVAPLLRTPDVLLVVSPCFPALAVAITYVRIRSVPWVLNIQDILPDGAIATGLLEEGALIRWARKLERAAYRSADHITVISDTFVENLRSKGVPESKITRVYNPATRPPVAIRDHDGDGVTALNMGNIGLSQNLVELTRAFQRYEELTRMGARFVMAGDGVAGDDVRASIATDRVRVTGMLDDEQLEKELNRATVAVVSQRYEGTDFNVPSKLMNFMACGIPVVAAVPGDSEVASIVHRSGGGWVASGNAQHFCSVLARALRNPQDRRERSQAALRFARENFTAERLGSKLEDVLLGVDGRDNVHRFRDGEGPVRTDLEHRSSIAQDGRLGVSSGSEPPAPA